MKLLELYLELCIAWLLKSITGTLNATLIAIGFIMGCFMWIAPAVIILSWVFTGQGDLILAIRLFLMFLILSIALGFLCAFLEKICKATKEGYEGIRLEYATEIYRKKGKLIEPILNNPELLETIREAKNG